MIQQLLSPSDAILLLRRSGKSFTSISQALGRPANYATRILSGQIKEPSYLIVDKLRELASQLDKGNPKGDQTK